MKRFMLVLVMVIMCMSLSLKTVFSYDACDISTHIVPCTVSGVDMDTVFWANGTYAYEMFDWTPYAIFYDSTQVTVTNLSDPLNGIEGLSFFVPNNPKYVLYKNGTFWTSTGGYFKYYNVDFSTGWLGAGAPNFILAINLNPQAGGTVASSPTGDFSCTNGTCSGHFSGDVTLTANPATNWVFSYWDDGTTNYTTNPLPMTISSNKSLIAKFYKTFRNAVGNFYQTSGTYGDGECVTYVNHETGITKASGQAFTGNANTYYQEAIDEGYQVSSTVSRVGSIIVFAAVPNTSLENGHVAIVTAIDGTNITMEDQNWFKENGVGIISQHTVDTSNHSILGYIYYTP